jgi:hypothetical protein
MTAKTKSKESKNKETKDEETKDQETNPINPRSRQPGLVCSR